MASCIVPSCDRTDNKGNRDYCGMHYARVRRNGTPGDAEYRMDPGRSIEERVFAKLKASPGGCWLWHGATTKAGYGLIGDGLDLVYVHRWVYQFMVAEIPDGLVLDHLCCTPACANPEHLEPVTRAVNNERGGLTHGMRAHA